MRALLLAALAGTLMLTGCAEAIVSHVTTRTHAAYTDAHFANFVETCVVGRCRKGQVLAALGPPNQVLAQDRGDVFVYRRSERDTNVVNLNPSMVSGFGPTVPVPIYFRSTREGREDTLMLFFDADGVFRGRSLARGIDVRPEGDPP